MKKTTLCLLIAVLCFPAAAQKKALDHDAYDSWQSIPNLAVTDDGNVIAYQITPQEGDATLVFTNTATGKEISVSRGGTPTISRDGRWAVFTIKAPFAETRQAKIKKVKSDKMPKDSIAYIDLKTFEIKKMPEAGSFKSAISGSFVFGYMSSGKDSKSLVVVRPGNEPDTLRNVDKYVFDEVGSKLAVVFRKDKKDSLSADAVALYSLPSFEKTEIVSGHPFYSLPRFDASGDKFTFLASTDTNATGNKHCSIYVSDGIKTTEVLPQGYTEGFRRGWGVSENSSPRFSRSADRLFFGLSEYIPENDTTLVSFETAQLDIWNYDIYMTPPMQKARSSQLKTATCLASLDLRDLSRKKVACLANNIEERVTLIDGGDADYAVVADDSPYLINSTWDSNSLCDVSLVSLKDGTRKALFTGLNGTPRVSPGGKYIVWYDEGESDWFSYRLSDGATFNLTGEVDGTFYDDEDDHPMPKPNIDSPHWLDGDEAFLLADKFDIFKIWPDNSKKAINLTAGQGRAKNIQYRYTKLVRSDLNPALSLVNVSETIGPKETVWLTTFDRGTKMNGYASVNVAKAGLLSSFTAPKSYGGTVKAWSSDVIAFRKGDFRNPMDVYVTRDFWKTEKKYSAINPQIKDYWWGNMQLVKWTAYDGAPLEGLLVVPENLDPDKKYPMMVYFYEKYSESLYSHFSMAPSRSTVNIPFYASRGYVVFVPDIVYKDGHPGESAYNCICSGAEAMCDQFSFIDKSKMAIQGQSWGGYQTAYLVTRTDMFAAAGAGAPVGNMTSAYGGIRWESGMVRAMQYEHGQSRIGKSLWDEGGLDLYIENSPIFHTQNVSTPVLIMHNDNDGAVPWYQGIEFFMALRRFHHPAWLLEYNNEAHNLVERRNCKDLSIRLQQFFDHYLKGEPMPAWMKTGVPNTLKGQYFGFEYAE